MEAKVFEYLITVLEGDIDQHGHVNNVVYLKWVQEAAAAHWNFIATDQMKGENIWVVSRHEIDYLNSCFLDSKLVAKTWVGDSDGAKSVRFVDIYDSVRNKPVARVKTTWTLLDLKTKRPRRIREDFIKLFR